jgi:diguanylate cyclase (GGDEF)-like protein/PAS domain S-box-containing protein
MTTKLGGTDGPAGHAEDVDVGDANAWFQDALWTLSPIALAVLDDRGVIRRINQAYAQMLDAAPDSVIGESWADLVVDPVDEHGIELAALMAGHVATAVLDCVHASREGRWINVRCHLRSLPDPAGRNRVVVHALDVSEQVSQSRDVDGVAGLEVSFRQSLLGSAVPTALLDLNGLVTEVNDALVSHMSTEREQLLGRSIDPYMSLTAIRSFRNQWPELVVGRQATLRTRGEWRDGAGRHMWVEASASLIQQDSQPSHVVLQLVDVSTEQRAMDQLDYRSRHDPITGLPNRSEVMAALHRAVAHSQAGNRWLAVMFVDVDNFKQINDALGHESGDQVLEVLAGRLRDALKRSDFLGRMGGDEFVAVLEGFNSESGAASVAEELCVVARVPMTVAQTRISPTVSVGVAVGRGPAATPQLLRQADDAVRQSKRLGRNRWTTYHEGMAHAAQQRLATENAIREALSDKRLEAHFQPLVNLSSGRLVGYEALARLRDPSGNLAPNADFISVAEQSGLIVPVGRQVISQAIATIAQVDPDIRMAVNASSAQLNDPRFADDVISLLYAHDVEPSRLIVEVTETTILDLAEWARRAIDRLVDLGVGLAVDDFGTGFSSLSHLRDMPVTGLKLDRSFTAGLTSKASAPYRLAEGIAALAHSLRLHTVAEGIETQRQRELLQECGWVEGQGWLFGAATDRIN